MVQAKLPIRRRRRGIVRSAALPNIVTGYLDSAAKGMGEGGQRKHDDRYAVAEDYMQVVYKLWEGSWADDAVVADVRRESSPGPNGFAKSAMMARIISLMLCTSASRRRSARLYFTRQGLRRLDVPSPRATRNASSSPAHRKK